MIDHFLKNVIQYILVEHIPDDLLKTQETCNETMRTMPYVFPRIPDHFKTQEMCIRAVEEDPWRLYGVPDHFKTQEMCERAVEDEPETLVLAADHLKTEEICKEAVRRHPYLLQYVRDWLVTREEVYMWYDDSEYCGDDDEDNFFKWYDRYKKRKTAKPQQKKSSCPLLGTHQDTGIGVCLKMKIKETEKLWA